MTTYGRVMRGCDSYATGQVDLSLILLAILDFTGESVREK
jgi:hypothetical protein